MPTTRRSDGCSGCRTASRPGLEEATALDPGFAQAHAALALLGHEWGAAGSWREALQAAHAAAADHDLDDREVSFLDAVTGPAALGRGHRCGRPAPTRPALPA